MVRSVHPHARIGRVALDAAREMPGVVGAYALADLPEIGGPLGDPVPRGLEARPRPVLAGDKVRYVGEPIAVAVADDPARAADADAAVDVEYAPLEGAGDVESATRPGAPVLHDDVGSNVAGRVQRGFGDIAAAFSDEAVVVHQTSASDA